ncbi:nitric oxide synthase, salivary gland-like, partial [Diaphorina citri]|uniref:nitric-oxide synthase (NADPH) n=1 Tax=Diaphorina citri TaxID=121845 RepID=A0A3Q0JDR1_DIACI
VYTNNPTSTKALRGEIEGCINELQPDFLKFDIENVVRKERMYHLSRGVHRFAVFALGSSAYPNFAAFGSYVDTMLGELGGERLLKLRAGDEMCGQEQAFRSWAPEVFNVACETFCLDDDETLSDATQVISSVTLNASTVRFLPMTTADSLVTGLSKVHSRKVWQCPLIKKWNLYGSQPVARTTLGIQMRKPHDCAYEPGDHVGIFASNKWDLVSGILARLNLGGIDPDEPMELQVLSETHTSTEVIKSWKPHERLPRASLRTLLSRYLDITTPPPPALLQFFATFATAPDDQEILTLLATDSAAYEDWRHWRFPHLLEVLEQFPSIHLPPALLVAQLTPLQPRFYSISSSPLAHPNEIHLTVAVVTYRTQAYEDWRHWRFPHLLEVLEQFPSIHLPPALLVAQLTPLQPRFYSISSSPLAHPNEIHLTVAVVTYRTQGLSKVHSRKVWQCPLIKKWNLYGSQPVAFAPVTMRKPHDCAYEPGDHVGIFASNKWDLVSGILARLNLGGIDPDEPMELQVLSETHTSTEVIKSWKPHERLPRASLRTLLSRYLDITTPPPPALLQFFATFATAPDDQEILTLLATVSTPASCHILTARIAVRIPAETAPNFHLPKEEGRSIICVGPGTGVAPFRGFWEHRYAQKMQNSRVIKFGLQELGKMTLFFGCQLKTMDLYSDEKSKMLDQKVLTKSFLALSREPTIPKTYVQDLMKKEASMLYRELIKEGGHFYVCGDCTMAEHVYQTLKYVFQHEGNLTEQNAEKLLLRLRDENRYHEDIFGITLRTAEVHKSSRESARIRMYQSGP